LFSLASIQGAKVDNKKYYNILTIDGGGIRGIIPGVAIGHLETEAAKYCDEKGYKYPKYEGIEGKVAMKDLFDMMGGTSTGSILSAGLSYPSGKVNADKLPVPGFWAKELLEIYTKEGNRIFTASEGPSTSTQVILFFVVTIITGSLGYLLGRYIWDNPRDE